MSVSDDGKDFPIEVVKAVKTISDWMASERNITTFEINFLGHVNVKSHQSRRHYSLVDVLLMAQNKKKVDIANANK